MIVKSSASGPVSESSFVPTPSSSIATLATCRFDASVVVSLRLLIRLVSVTVPGSFTSVTVSVAVSLATLKAVVPPFTDASAVAPWIPLVWSQAWYVNWAVSPLTISGTYRISAVGPSSNADVGLTPVIGTHNAPPSIEYCHWPFPVSPVTAMPGQSRLMSVAVPARIACTVIGLLGVFSSVVPSDGKAAVSSGAELTTAPANTATASIDSPLPSFRSTSLPSNSVPAVATVVPEPSVVAVTVRTATSSSAAKRLLVPRFTGPCVERTIDPTARASPPTTVDCSIKSSAVIWESTPMSDPRISSWLAPPVVIGASQMSCSTPPPLCTNSRSPARTTVSPIKVSCSTSVMASALWVPSNKTESVPAFAPCTRLRSSRSSGSKSIPPTKTALSIESIQSPCRS